MQNKHVITNKHADIVSNCKYAKTNCRHYYIDWDDTPDKDYGDIPFFNFCPTYIFDDLFNDVEGITTNKTNVNIIKKDHTNVLVSDFNTNNNSNFDVESIHNIQYNTNNLCNTSVTQNSTYLTELVFTKSIHSLNNALFSKNTDT